MNKLEFIPASVTSSNEPLRNIEEAQLLFCPISVIVSGFYGDIVPVHNM